MTFIYELGLDTQKLYQKWKCLGEGLSKL